jgi:uncharacterized linocin/CFP29 family protein
MPLTSIQYLIGILKGTQTATISGIFAAVSAIIAYLTVGGDPEKIQSAMFVPSSADESLLRELERLEAVGKGEVTTSAAIPTALLIQLLTGFLQKWLADKLFSS